MHVIANENTYRTHYHLLSEIWTEPVQTKGCLEQELPPASLQPFLSKPTANEELVMTCLMGPAPSCCVGCLTVTQSADDTRPGEGRLQQAPAPARDEVCVDKAKCW